LKPGSVILLALAGTAVGGMPMWLMSAYAPQIIQTLSLSSTTYGALLGAFFGFSALTATTVGRYVNRINWLVGVGLTSLFSVVGLVILAVFSGNVPMILLGLFVAAWGNSFSQTSANKGLAEFVPPNLRGRAFGFKQAAMPLSTFLVGLSVPLFASGQNWRLAVIAISVLSAGVGIAAISQIGDKHAVAKNALPRLRQNFRTSRGGQSKKKIKAPRYLFLLASGAGLATGATMSFTGFLVLFSVDLGFSLEASAAVMVVGSFAGIGARIFLGFWADRAKSGHLLMVQFLMLGGSIGMVLVAVAGEFEVLVIGTLLVFVMGWSWNGVFQFAIIRSGPASSSYFTGIVQAAMMAGATVGPPIFSILIQANYPTAWIFLACTMALSAGLVRWGMIEMGPIA
jgi:MFS family permease